MSSPARRGKVVQAGTVVLALNCGSSSLKFGLYRVTSSRTEMLLDGEAEAFGDGSGKFFFAQDAHGKLRVSERLATAGPREAIVRIERLLAQSGLPPPASIGHRIVHGGPALDHHALIDDRVMSQLEAATDFAPWRGPSWTRS